jgi:hypothetical protein
VSTVTFFCVAQGRQPSLRFFVVNAWKKYINNKLAGNTKYTINWRFTTADARIKVQYLYLQFE